MSGLRELIQKERIEDEVTSTVPKAKSDYLENYEPSAAKGLAGIAIAGAGAFALRNPIGRVISKLTNLKTPKAPVSRNTAPVIDEVDEVLNIAPTRVERGRELVKLSEQEQIRQEAITRSNELKKIAYMNPLSRGGKTNRIGSSLWDYIARHPIAGARKADEWIRDFKSTGPGSFRTGNPEFKNISQAVKKDELWDSNIAQFDKAGNLVGGFLKVAQEKKIPLTKMDLLYIVEKAPVNNLKVRKLRMNTQVVDEAEDSINQINSALTDIRNKVVAIPSRGKTEAEIETLAQLVKDATATQKSLSKIGARINNKLRVVDQEDVDDFNNIFQVDIQAFQNIADKARNAGVAIDPNEVTRIVNFAKGKDIEIGRKVGLMKTQGLTPKYGSYNEYRIKGGDSYFEDVVYYPKPLPMGQRLPSGYNNHYSGVPNQVYHVRGSIRSGGEPGQKVMMIDEIQSDYAQKLRNVDPTRMKVKNAFGAEIEFFSSNRKLEKIIDEMKQIGSKGVNTTTDDMFRFRKLKSDFDELKKNSLNLSNITKQDASDGIPFLPLYGKENWGSHALKNTIKNAADEGVDWVAIAPVERLHHAKRSKYLGDIEFYGTRSGKAGFDNYKVMSKRRGDNEVEVLTDPKKVATLPAEMKRLAQQYNSTVGTIQVAKSDPKKPFKIVKNVGTNKKFKLGKESEGTEHEVAFRTADEAKAYSERYGGDVVEILEGDPRLYFEAYAIKVSPDMINKPFKAYQSGGLVVNIFA